MKTSRILLVTVLFTGLLTGCGEESTSENAPTNEGQMSSSGPQLVNMANNADTIPTEPTQTIAEILETDPRFSEVLELVNLIGLLDAMRSPGPFTVFVPINSAVQAMPETLLEEIRTDQNYLHEFILTHVAEGDYSTSDLAQVTEVEMIGRAVDISPSADGEVLIGNSKVLEADIVATNGRLHALETVISLPANDDE